MQRLLTLQKHTDLSDHGAKLLCDKLLNNVDNLERLQELVLWHSMDCTGKANIKEEVDDTTDNYDNKGDADDIKTDVGKMTCCQPLKDKILRSSDNQLRLTPTPPLKRDLSLSDMDAVHQLQRFLLSVTAKDVSLLLTFRPMEEQGEENKADGLPMIEMEETGKRYRVMISVIDLDHKPVHRIRHWVKRKEEWLKIYSDSVKSLPGFNPTTDDNT